MAAVDAKDGIVAEEEEGSHHSAAAAPVVPPADPLRGYVGDIYEEVFKELYQPPAPAPQPKVEVDDPEAEGEAAEADAEPAAEDPDFISVDLSAEEAEIAALHARLGEEHARLDLAAKHLREKKYESIAQDQEHAQELQTKWGLTMREQVPVDESKLKTLLDSRYLEKEQLLVPRNMMTDVERQTAIKNGLQSMHGNLLAASKPDEPHYLKGTASTKIRMTTRNIKSTYTDAQRTAIAADLQERANRRPVVAATLNPEERKENQEILTRMLNKISFLKNPRYDAQRLVKEGGQNPFAILPETVIFRNFEVGGIYEAIVELRNVTSVGRRVRVLPCQNPAFSISPLVYTSDTKGALEPFSVIAPGMAALLTVHFAPTSLNDVTEQLQVCTEVGDFWLPVLARRVHPLLDFQEPIHCGEILAGEQVMVTTRISNRGGEGSFRLIAREADMGDNACHYESVGGEATTLVSNAFRVSPATFYLETNSSVEIEVCVSAKDVGRHHLPLLIESDIAEKVPFTLTAIVDAVRVELVRWPTLLHPVKPCTELPPGVAPLSLIPWQLSWLSPGVQVGNGESQAITISNGSYLPVTLEWRIVRPPRQLQSQLAVGARQRLTEDLMEEAPSWWQYDQAAYGTAECPFAISPRSLTVEPFRTATFTFSFFAYAPVGRRATVFAYLAALDLPSGKHCLPPLGRLIEMQQEMQPEEYQKGLPLFGGAAGKLFDVRPAAGAAVVDDVTSDTPPKLPTHLERASCSVTTVCLQGISLAPSIVCLPRAIALSGDVLPFMAHTREVVLKNSGQMPACFRVRLSSAKQQENPEKYEPLWIVGAHEVGPKPEPQGQPDATATAAPGDSMRLVAEQIATQWPPLPPDGGNAAASDEAGFGAYVTIAVEPHEGKIPPGQSAKLRVTIRVAKEVDLNVQLFVDVPGSLAERESVVPPIQIPVVAAVRSPRVELRQTSFLDYGVVRAHSRHTAKLCLSNPSDMPMLVRLRHEKGEEMEQAEDSTFDDEPNLSAQMRAYNAVLAARGLPAKSNLEFVKARDAMSVHNDGQATASAGGPSQGKTEFPMRTHWDVANFFVHAVLDGHAQNFMGVLGEEMLEANDEQFVHSRSGCIDMSGRRKHKFVGRNKRRDASVTRSNDGIVDDSEDFIFDPACLVLWPRQTAEVMVTLRTSEVQKYRALLRASCFDSTHTQWVEVYAEVQLPKLRLSTQHAHMPVTYLKVASTPYVLELINDSDMLATFEWQVPVKLEAGLELQIHPMTGEVTPRGSTTLQLVALPTRVAEKAELACQVFVGENIQPLVLQVSATVYGAEIDWAIVPSGVLPPTIVPEPRKPGQENSGTYAMKVGRASRGTPIIDFGEIKLGETRDLQLVLYNRTGIATPFAVQVANYPAHDPLLKGRKIGTLLDAATRMYQISTGTKRKEETMQTLETQTFSNEPQPAAQGAEISDTEILGTRGNVTAMPSNIGKRSMAKSKASVAKFAPRSRGASAKKNPLAKRRLLLDDAHEKVPFQSKVGAEYTKQKESKQQGSIALQNGQGWAVKCTPVSDWLLPFSVTKITLTCFSDLPGKMEDELIVCARQLPGHSEGGNYRIPVRLASQGNPLYLPDQQTGLNLMPDPPRLLCGTITPAEKYTTRQFKVGNNSSIPMKICWKVYPKSQISNVADTRRFLSVALCRDDAANAAVATEEEVGEDDPEVEQLIEELAMEDIGDDEEETKPPFKFEMFAREPPQVNDRFAIPDTLEPPVRIDQEEAIIPSHGTTLFTVTMTATKAMPKAADHYSYMLVGKGRFTDGHARLGRRGGAADFEAAHSETLEVTRPAATSKRGNQVAGLPSIPLSENDLLEDDSDREDPRGQSKLSAAGATSAATRLDVDDLLDVGGGRPVPPEPEGDVISTIVVDCVGDCVLPMLTIDKKVDPSVDDFLREADADDSEEPTDRAQRKAPNCPVFKFTHSFGATPSTEKRETGAVHGGARGGSQLPGVASYLVRTIPLINHNACTVTCRLRIEGPFQVKQISQAGCHDVKPLDLEQTRRKRKSNEPPPPPDPIAQPFAVPKKETLSMQVEFVPEKVPASAWSPEKATQTFTGDMTIEYPRDLNDATAPVDCQRIHFVATCRRPAVKITCVPHAKLDTQLQTKLAHHPPWAGQQPVVVEFGYVHVESSISRKREVLLSNDSPVTAMWRLLHVGRKRRPPHDIGNALREEEDFRAQDHKDAFEFNVSEGILQGPTKEGMVYGSKERQVNWCAVPAAQPRGAKPVDDHHFEPQRIQIVFRPKTNELYKSRFRFQVEQGLSVDVICRGCGSYDEEDDELEFQEC